jgi:hypothetical protein
MGLTGGPGLVAWLDQEDAQLRETIRQHRWAVQYVGPGVGPYEPAFAYTIGLFGFAHPELLVTNLDPEDGHRLLNCAATEVVAGTTLVPGERFDDEDGCCWDLAACPNPGEVVLGANRWFQRAPHLSVPVVELLHPGSAVPGTWTA